MSMCNVLSLKSLVYPGVWLYLIRELKICSENNDYQCSICTNCKPRNISVVHSIKKAGDKRYRVNMHFY